MRMTSHEFPCLSKPRSPIWGSMMLYTGAANSSRGEVEPSTWGPDTSTAVVPEWWSRLTPVVTADMVWENRSLGVTWVTDVASAMYSITGESATKSITGGGIVQESAGAGVTSSITGAGAVCITAGAGAACSITGAGAALVASGVEETCSTTGADAIQVTAGAGATYSVTSTVHFKIWGIGTSTVCCCSCSCERWDLCWSTTLPWNIEGHIWVENHRACMQRWDRRKDWRSGWNGWERTCACGQCQVRQRTRHDTWITNISRTQRCSILRLPALEPRVFAWWKCDHAVQLCTCCICGCTVHSSNRANSTTSTVSFKIWGIGTSTVCCCTYSNGANSSTSTVHFKTWDIGTSTVCCCTRSNGAKKSANLRVPISTRCCLMRGRDTASAEQTRFGRDGQGPTSEPSRMNGIPIHQQAALCTRVSFATSIISWKRVHVNK